MDPRSISDYNATIGDRRSPQEILQISANYEKKLPRIFTGSLSSGSFLFNSLTLITLTHDRSKMLLSASLDSASLFRLVLNAGGESVTIPSYPELVTSYAIVIGIYAVHCHGKSVYQTHRLINRLLKELEVKPVTISEFRSLTMLTSQDILRGITKRDVNHPPILETLQGAIEKFERAADLCLQKATKSNDPDTLLQIYEEIQKLTKATVSFLDNIFAKFSKE